MLFDLSDRQRADECQVRLAALVDASNDAIVGEDLNGVVTSWNAWRRGRLRVFRGRNGGGLLGRLTPADRLEEEIRILEQLRRGERVELRETLRRTKDGRMIDVSLTASPLRDAGGEIVGAVTIGVTSPSSRIANASWPASRGSTMR